MPEKIALLRSRFLRLDGIAALLSILSLALIVSAMLVTPGSSEYRAINAIQTVNLPYARQILSALSQLTEAPAIVALWAVLLVAFGLVRWWGALVSTLTMTAGGVLVFIIDTFLVGRPGPEAGLLHRSTDLSSAPAFPSGHVIGSMMLFGLIFFVARHIANAGLRLALRTTSVAVIVLVGFSRVWLGGQWISDVIAGYVVGLLFLIALLKVERRVGAACDGIPFVHGAYVPHDDSRPHSHALTSTVVFNGPTVSKIYAPGFLPRAIYWLAFQAEFPYMRNQAALRAALLRRKLAGLLTEYWYGSNLVIPVLRIDQIDGRSAVTSSYLDGISPRDHLAARAFLFDLSHRFDEVGLPTWQVDPHQPRAMSNILEATDGRYHIIDLESGLVSPMASPRAWWRAFRRGLIPLFDDVFFDLTRSYVSQESDTIRASKGAQWLTELQATLDQCEQETGTWHAGEPRIWSRIVRGLTTGFGLGAWGGRIWNRTQGSQERAERWLDLGIGAWERDARITAPEAARLREEISEPQFLAVLPHLGVHLTIGVFLRFPLGSITRASYALANLLAMTFRFLARRIDRKTWQFYLGIHSPLVIIIAGMPGIGTFAYLAAKPIRSHHLLLRVALDAVLLKFPWRVYERSGLRWMIARPADVNARDGETELAATIRPMVKLAVWPQSIIQSLAFVAGLILAVFVFVSAVDYVFAPSVVGWDEFMRLVDVNATASLAHGFAVAILVLCAALLALIAYAKWHRGDPFKYIWLLLVPLSLGLALVEGARLDGSGRSAAEVLWEQLWLRPAASYGWLVLEAVAVIVLALALRRFVMRLTPLDRKLVLVATALYVGGKVGAAIIGRSLGDQLGGEPLLDVFAALVEAALGMASLLIALTALLLYAQRDGGDLYFTLRGNARNSRSRVASPTKSMTYVQVRRVDRVARRGPPVGQARIGWERGHPWRPRTLEQRAKHERHGLSQTAPDDRLATTTRSSYRL